MTINYTSLLGLAQPVTGTESGTWGDDVNNGLTIYLDAAVAGAQTLSTDADATLSITNGSSSATNLGATSAQYAILNCTGARTAQRNINVPNSSKTYWVLNQTTGGYAVKVRGVTGPTTGVTIANGRMALIAWNGSDFSVVASNDVNALLGFGTGVATALGVATNTSGGVVTQTGTLTASTLLVGGGSGTAISSATTGTGVVTALGNNANAAAGFVTGTGTATLQNKRIDPRVSSTTSAASITPDISAYDMYVLTAQAVGLTINAPTGTPLDGDKLIFRILDNGGSQNLTWNATYTVVGVLLPTSTTPSKILYVGCIYNAANARWDVVASSTQS